MSSHPESGFTLVELVTVVAVAAVLTAIALPSFQGTMRSNRVATTTNEVLASLAFARSEAIRSTRFSSVCGSQAGTACDGEWTQGWLVFADRDGDGQLESNDTVLRFGQGNPKLSVGNPSGDVVTFDARGRRLSNADQVVVLQPDECGEQPLRRTLTINASGQIRVQRGDCE